MGCKGSKASSPAVSAPAKSTLLDSADQKASGPECFPIFIDSLGESFALAENDTKTLQVNDVQGGSIGLWNNRARTEKVRKGDFVVRVRKAGPNAATWVDGDAQEMLEVLRANGPFEVEIKRAPPQESEQKAAKEEPAETPVTVQVEEQVAPVLVAGAEAPAKVSEESQEVAVVPNEVVEDQVDVKKGVCSLWCSQ